MKKIIKVCKGGSCMRCLSSEIKKHLEKTTDHTIEDCNCMGQCENSPNIKVDETIYTHVTPKEALRIAEEN